MSKTWLGLVAVGLCVGCHPKHKPKKPPHLEVAVSNDCDEAVTVVVGSNPEADADVIEVQLEGGETIVWTLQDGERIWSRDDEDAEWIAAPVEDDGGGSTVVSACVSSRFAG